MSSASAIKLAPDPKERHEFGFRALRKIKLDDGVGDDNDVQKKTPFQVRSCVPHSNSSHIKCLIL